VGGAVLAVADMKASHFSNFDYVAIEALRVLPPLEPKDKSINWARGSIRDGDFNELLVTGPRLPVLFSGCRYNNIVFSIRGPGEDEPSYAFETFLHKVLSHVESTVSASVEKFKPGLKNAALLQFDRDFIRPSSYSSDMPNELRVKLAVKRGETDEHGEVVDMIETSFVDEHGNSIDPNDISSGSEIVPIMKIGYYRNGNKFGLNMTMLKGLVYPSLKRARPNLTDLEFDLP
jgi:hypothetical protein